MLLGRVPVIPPLRCDSPYFADTPDKPGQHWFNAYLGRKVRDCRGHWRG